MARYLSVHGAHDNYESSDRSGRAKSITKLAYDIAICACLRAMTDQGIKFAPTREAVHQSLSNEVFHSTLEFTGTDVEGLTWPPPKPLPRDIGLNQSKMINIVVACADALTVAGIQGFESNECMNSLWYDICEFIKRHDISCPTQPPHWHKIKRAALANAIVHTSRR